MSFSFPPPPPEAAVAVPARRPRVLRVAIVAVLLSLIAGVIGRHHRCRGHLRVWLVVRRRRRVVDFAGNHP
ncbi:MAG: hypothetical protein ACKOE7_03685, partial [Actinomycetota bacterium]